MEFDKDLQARQEARILTKQAKTAQRQLATMSQSQLDKIVEAIADAFSKASVELADMAVRETGFGNVEDKTVKNEFASRTVANAIRGMKTVGVLKENPAEKLWEVGVPVGVIAAIVPSTNPTSTVCYKAMIAIKAGNSIVFSPHPKAILCTLRAVQIVAQAAVGAGAPPGSISCLGAGSMAGCQELMGAKEVNLILATGGPATHDLRTPLTSIYGACSVILEEYDDISRQQHIKLLKDIRSDAQWLVRMVENLLSVTRLDSEKVHIAKDGTVLDELVGR